MRSNVLRELLTSGRPAVNAWLSSGDPYSAEVLGHCGYDAVTVDLQHGMFDVSQAVRCLQALSSTPATPLVRCRSHLPSEIGHLLDAGAYGVICPDVNSASQALEFVAACRYPPTGTRSFGPSRGLLHGGPDYVEHANTTVLAIAMIESTAAIDDLDAILAVPGLDAIYVGPNDLSMDAGFAPLTPDTSEELATALRHIADRAAVAGTPAGIFALTAEQGREFAGWGYQMVTPGNDMGLLRAESVRRIDVLRAGR